VNTVRTLKCDVSRPRRNIARVAAGIFGATLFLSAAIVLASTQRTFTSPQDGVDALVQAVNASNEAALRAMFGPDADTLLSSGDKVADAHNRSVFSKAYAEAHRLDLTDGARAMLIIGNDAWPMPIPLVKEGDRWRFDTKKGRDEILARRIGRNELSAMKVCLAIADAEHDYATHDLDADGLPEYASRFVSRSGKRDGLYWPTSPDQTASPLGPLLAAAADEGYAHPGVHSLAPYHGYYYRILTRQGKAAPGGARNYFVRGKLIGGFAVLAYPARYRASGVMTFVVSDTGAIYQKNLGPDTRGAAESIMAFDPDETWNKAEMPQ
jgi:ribosomal protein L34